MPEKPVNMPRGSHDDLAREILDWSYDRAGRLHADEDKIAVAQVNAILYVGQQLENLAHQLSRFDEDTASSIRRSLDSLAYAVNENGTQGTLNVRVES